MPIIYGSTVTLARKIQKISLPQSFYSSRRHTRFSFTSHSRLPTSEVGASVSMASYRKYRGKRRRTYKRRRPYSGYAIAKTALKKVRKLEQKREIKEHLVGLTTLVNVTSAGVVGVIAFIPQGDGAGERDGNKISPFLLNLNLRWIGDAVQDDEVMRTIIYTDTKTVKGATAAVTDVLTAANAMALIQTVNRGRFVIHYDECFTGSDDGNVRLSFVRKLRIRLTRSISFDGALASDVVKNGLYMINVTSTASNNPDVSYTFRLSYND